MDFVGTSSFQCAWAALVRAAVSPSTTAVLPTKPSACVDCADCCSAASSELVLSCCSTPANCTSCWVNWLVSSGSSGFWFCNCVVSSVRKVWKLSAIPGVVVEAVVVVVFVLVVDGADTTVPGIVASTAMVISSDLDIDAAARSEHAAIGSSRDRRGNGVVFADDQAVGVAARSAVVVLTG